MEGLMFRRAPDPDLQAALSELRIAATEFREALRFVKSIVLPVAVQKLMAASGHQSNPLGDILGGLVRGAQQQSAPPAPAVANGHERR